MPKNDPYTVTIVTWKLKLKLKYAKVYEVVWISAIKGKILCLPMFSI